MRNFLLHIWNGFIWFFASLFGWSCKWCLQRNLLYFPFISEYLSRISFSFGIKFRQIVYSYFLPSIPKDVFLHHGVKIEDQRTSFGKDVWISSGVYIDYVIFGDHVLVGPQAILLAGGKQHRFARLDIPVKLQGNDPKMAIHIDHGAWIGAGAIIMADIGRDAIVGAGSVVTKPVPPYAIVAGNPATIIRMRTDEKEKA